MMERAIHLLKDEKEKLEGSVTRNVEEIRKLQESNICLLAKIRELDAALARLTGS